MNKNNKLFRMFHIVQQEQYLSGKKIKEVLSEYDSIKKYAYIIHNKDRYTAEDEYKNPNHKEGTIKDSHWHLYIELSTNRASVETIARWFSIPEHCVRGIKGKNESIECLKYLTHSSKKSKDERKYQYNSDNIISNFDWEDKVRDKSNDDKKIDKIKLRSKVCYEGLNVNKLKEENGDAYTRDDIALDRMRTKYINDKMPPNVRVNYYICGDGGNGKSVLSKILARNLYPELKKDEDIFFEVGSDKVLFDSYNGQPVIIWNDFRSNELVSNLNGFGNVFKVFDIHPSKSLYHVKFGKINLCNEVNIINGIQSRKEFLDGLVNEQEDWKQSYRRFPFIISMKDNAYDYFVNKGIFMGTKQYKTYQKHANINCYVNKIVKINPGEEREEVEKFFLETILNNHKELIKKFDILDKETNTRLCKELLEQIKKDRENIMIVDVDDEID